MWNLSNKKNIITKDGRIRQLYYIKNNKNNNLRKVKTIEIPQDTNLYIDYNDLKASKFNVSYDYAV